jgi:hypothetical protein
LHFVDGEAAQGQPQKVAETPQLGKGAGQRVGTIDLDVAVGSDDEQTCICWRGQLA